MPGERSVRRDSPEIALRLLEKEGEPNISALKTLLEQVAALGMCKFDDPNKTRAVALAIMNGHSGRWNQFFAITTPKHRSINAPIGPLGFNVHVAFRAPHPQAPRPGWFESFHQTGNVKWWHYKPTALNEVEIAQILNIAAQVRESFTTG